MKFQDIPADILTLRVKPTGNAVALREQPVLSVEADPSRPDQFDIRLRDALVSVRPVADNDVSRLNAELASGRALLAQLDNPAPTAARTCASPSSRASVSKWAALISAWTSM